MDLVGNLVQAVVAVVVEQVVFQTVTVTVVPVEVVDGRRITTAETLEKKSSGIVRDPLTPDMGRPHVRYPYG